MATDINANLIFKSNEQYRLPADDHAACVGDWEEATAGAAIALMASVMQMADGDWEETDADAEATANGDVGIAMTAAVGDGDTFIVVTKGVIRYNTWNWADLSNPIFLSTTTGELSQTAPSGNDDIKRIMGYPRTADGMKLDPDKSYVKVVVP